MDRRVLGGGCPRFALFWLTWVRQVRPSLGLTCGTALRCLSHSSISWCRVPRHALQFVSTHPLRFLVRNGVCDPAFDRGGCPTHSRFSNEWDSEITGLGVFHHRPHI